MKPLIIIYFFCGYLLFIFLLECFGITDLLIAHYQETNYNNTSTAFIRNNSSSSSKHEIIKPDDTSTALTMSKEELGMRTWSLIHSIAAAYPMEPNTEERQAIVKFIDSL